MCMLDLLDGAVGLSWRWWLRIRGGKSWGFGGRVGRKLLSGGLFGISCVVALDLGWRIEVMNDGREG